MGIGYKGIEFGISRRILLLLLCRVSCHLVDRNTELWSAILEYFFLKGTIMKCKLILFRPGSSEAQNKGQFRNEACPGDSYITVVGKSQVQNNLPDPFP